MSLPSLSFPRLLLFLAAACRLGVPLLSAAQGWEDPLLSFKLPTRKKARKGRRRSKRTAFAGAGTLLVGAFLVYKGLRRAGWVGMKMKGSSPYLTFRVQPTSGEEAFEISFRASHDAVQMDLAAKKRGGNQLGSVLDDIYDYTPADWNTDRVDILNFVSSPKVRAAVEELLKRGESEVENAIKAGRVDYAPRKRVEFGGRIRGLLSTVKGIANQQDRYGQADWEADRQAILSLVGEKRSKAILQHGEGEVAAGALKDPSSQEAIEFGRDMRMLLEAVLTIGTQIDCYTEADWETDRQAILGLVRSEGRRTIEELLDSCAMEVASGALKNPNSSSAVKFGSKIGRLLQAVLGIPSRIYCYPLADWEVDRQLILGLVSIETRKPLRTFFDCHEDNIGQYMFTVSCTWPRVVNFGRGIRRLLEAVVEGKLVGKDVDFPTAALAEEYLRQNEDAFSTGCLDRTSGMVESMTSAIAGHTATLVGVRELVHAAKLTRIENEFWAAARKAGANEKETSAVIHVLSSSDDLADFRRKTGLTSLQPTAYDLVYGYRAIMKSSQKEVLKKMRTVYTPQFMEQAIAADPIGKGSLWTQVRARLSGILDGATFTGLLDKLPLEAIYKLPTEYEPPKGEQGSILDCIGENGEFLYTVYYTPLINYLHLAACGVVEMTYKHVDKHSPQFPYELGANPTKEQIKELANSNEVLELRRLSKLPPYSTGAVE